MKIGKVEEQEDGSGVFPVTLESDEYEIFLNIGKKDGHSDLTDDEYVELAMTKVVTDKIKAEIAKLENSNED